MNIGIIYLAIAATCATTYSAMQKITSQYFSPAIAVLFSSGVVFIVGIGLLLFQKVSNQTILFTPQKIFYPVMVGLFAAGIDFFAVLAYSKKVPLNTGAVISGAIGVFLTVVYGKFIFQEGVTVLRVIALVLAALSTVLISISF